MVRQLTISNRCFFLVAFLNRASFQYLSFKHASDKSAYWLEYVSVGFAKRAGLIPLMPFRNAAHTKDLITLLAFLRIKDNSKTNIAFEIIWGFSWGINSWWNQVTKVYRWKLLNKVLFSYMHVFLLFLLIHLLVLFYLTLHLIIY